MANSPPKLARLHRPWTRSRVAWAALLGLSACAPKPAPYVAPVQPAIQRPTAMDVVGKAWFDCVRASFARIRVAIPNRNDAIEATFQACATEERAVEPLLSSPDVLARHKFLIKQSMLAGP